MHTIPLYTDKGFPTSLLDSQGPNSQCVVDYPKSVQTRSSRALDKSHHVGRTTIFKSNVVNSRGGSLVCSEHYGGNDIVRCQIAPVKTLLRLLDPVMTIRLFGAL
jgi:hypothetical protein